MVYEQIMNLVNVVLLLAYVCFTFGSCVMMFTLKQSNLSVTELWAYTRIYFKKLVHLHTSAHVHLEFVHFIVPYARMTIIVIIIPVC